MNTTRRYLFTLSLILAITLPIAACSGDDEDQARDQAEQTATTPDVEVPVESSANTADPGQYVPIESAIATVDPGQFVLRVQNGSYLSTVLPVRYRERCLDEQGDERECSFLRSLLIVELTMALEEIERSRDQRGADEALAALDLDQEPQVLVAALRVLGQFRDTPEIPEKVLPLMLESPWIRVQELAATVLNGNPDPTSSGIGSLWINNHSTLYAEFEHSEYPDFAPHYLDMEFPDYPDAEWFSPADSDRSVGWSSTDDSAAVINWMREALDVEPRDFQQWTDYMNAQSMAAFQSMDQSKQAELERLIDEFGKNQDPALMERAQKLQQEIYAPMEKAGKIAELGVGNIYPPNLPGVVEAVRYFVAEEKDGHVARLIIVYPLATLGRTVIQEAWSLADYPSAWPPIENTEQ